MKRLVKIVLGSYEFKDEWWGGIYDCPNCKCSNIWAKFKYCPDCGYKIEWLENETAVKGGE